MWELFVLIGRLWNWFWRPFRWMVNWFLNKTVSYDLAMEAALLKHEHGNKLKEALNSASNNLVKNASLLKEKHSGKLTGVLCSRDLWVQVFALLIVTIIFNIATWFWRLITTP